MVDDNTAFEGEIEPAPAWEWTVVQAPEEGEYTGYLVEDPNTRERKLVGDDHPAVSRHLEVERERQAQEDRRKEREQRTVVAGPRDNPSRESGKPRQWQLDTGEWVSGTEYTDRETSGYPAVDRAEQDLLKAEYEAYHQERSERTRAVLARQAAERDAKAAAARVAETARNQTSGMALGQLAAGAILDGTREAGAHTALRAERSLDWGVPVEVGYTPDATPKDELDGDIEGVNQRLRIRVPNVWTQLTLGQALGAGEQDSEKAGYSGFGVRTRGHVFLESGMGKHDGHMKLQAHADMSLQSEAGAIYGSAPGGVTAVTGGGVTMAGCGSVVIAGGVGAYAELNRDVDGPSPLPPDGMAAAKESWETVSSVISAVGYAKMAAGLLFTALSDRLRRGEWEKSDGMMALAGQSWKSLASLAVGQGTKFGGPYVVPSFKGTLIYGETGGSVISPVSASVYGGLSASLASVDSVGIWGGRSCSVLAGDSLSMTSAGKVSIAARKSSELIARGAVYVGSHRDALDLTGRRVRIGVIAEKPQQRCESVRASGDKELRMMTDGAFESSAGRSIRLRAGYVGSWPNESDSDEENAGLVHILAAKHTRLESSVNAEVHGGIYAAVIGGQRAEIQCGGSALALDGDVATLRVGSDYAQPKIAPGPSIKDMKARSDEAKTEAHNAAGTRLEMRKDGVEIHVASSSIKLKKSKVVSGPIEWKS